MVKAVEDGARQDATGELWRVRNGLLLADALVRPCLIVEDDERGEQAPEVLVAKHEDVVEQLPPERAHEALKRRRSCSARVRRCGRPSLRWTRRSLRIGHPLPITISNQDFGLVVHSGILGLLRAPVFGGHRGGSCVNDLAAFEADEEQDERRGEESLEGLNEVTAPGDVVLDEGAPVLSVIGDASGHVPLHVRFERWIPSLRSSPRMKVASTASCTGSSAAPTVAHAGLPAGAVRAFSRLA